MINQNEMSKWIAEQEAGEEISIAQIKEVQKLVFLYLNNHIEQQGNARIVRYRSCN